MLTLSMIKGTSRDFALQANNSDGTPALNLFLDTDTIASRVWRGDSQILLLSPASSWISASLGTFQVTFNDLDTSTFESGQYRIQTTAARTGRTAVILDGQIQITDAPGSVVSTDLVTQDYLALNLASIGVSDIDSQLLSQLSSAASRLIRKHCNRWFNRRPSGSITAYDGLYTMDWPSRCIVLRQFPVNGILRARTNPTQVFNVTNTSSANQQAWVSLTYSGVADISDIAPATTGMSLSRMSSGVLSTTTLTLTGSNATFNGLANSINALGNGWSAQITDSAFSNWPTADLRQGVGPSCAIGQFSQQGFWVHTDDIPVQVDQEAGIVMVEAGSFDPWSSPRFGLYLDTGLGDLDIGGGINGLRIMYDAGWDTVPEDIQQACIETVADMLNLLKIDQRLRSESAGDYSYDLADGRYALPPSVVGKLGYYRNIRV